MDYAELEQRINDDITKIKGYFMLAKTAPHISDKPTVAKIILKEVDDYLDLLREIMDNGHRNLVSRFGADLLMYHNVLELCVMNYLTLEDAEKFLAKYNIFHRFEDVLNRVWHEDMLNDKSGLWRTCKPK